MHRQLPLPAVALVALTACSPAAQDADGDRSSQGSPAWTVEETPLVSIGGASSGFVGDLYNIRGVVRLSDGRLVVADGAQRLVFFDAAGTHLQTVGQRGDGPGEFQTIMWIQGLPRDTILVWDLQNGRRLSYFSSDGVFARSVEPASPLRFIGALADGSLIVTKAAGYLTSAGPAGDDEVAWARPKIDLLRLDAEGLVLGSLGTFPDSEEVSLPASGIGHATMTLEDDRSPLFATLVVPALDRVYLTTGEELQVQVLSTEGRDVEATIGREVDLAPLTVDYLADFFPRFMSGYAISDRVRWDELQWNVPEGHTIPAITDFRLDEDGNLWIGQHRAYDDPSRIWHVYSRTGSYLARAVMPADFRPFTIETDVVLGVWRDDLDVEHVQVRRIAKD